MVLAQVAGGFRLRTDPENSRWVQLLLAERPARLSRSQLETLAVIAYRQPVTKPEIDHIRGVDCAGGDEDPARPRSRADRRTQGGAGAAAPVRHHAQVPRALQSPQPARHAGSARVPRADRREPATGRRASWGRARCSTSARAWAKKCSTGRRDGTAARATRGGAQEHDDAEETTRDRAQDERRRGRPTAGRRTTTRPGAGEVATTKRADGRPGARGRARTGAPTRQASRGSRNHVRLQKVLARAGVGSRREAEALIAAGRVKVDGRVVAELGTRIDPGAGAHRGRRQRSCRPPSTCTS